MDGNVRGQYASVNGLEMCYEVHGSGPPLILLHGALSGIGTSFGAVLPSLARSRRVIAVEQQAHGHTADIDRPLTLQNMADDTVALMGYLGIERADFFGYSMGAGIALHIAIQEPHLARKLVLAAVCYNRDGFHPGLLDGIQTLKPEDFDDSPFYVEFVNTSPDPDGWPALLNKVKEMDRDVTEWPSAAIQDIAAPTLLVIGDSDIVRPEHAVEMFRLLGGGVAGDVAGLPRSQLAVLPGTTHITLVHHGDWLSSMVEAFLAAPVPEAP